jgi:hypothetical protein
MNPRRDVGFMMGGSLLKVGRPAVPTSAGNPKKS